MGTYEEAAKGLLTACRAYRDRGIGLTELKAAAWDAASTFVNVDDRELRDFLQKAEGRLDIVEHSTNDAEVFDASLLIIDEIEDAMRRYLSNTSSNGPEP